MPITEDFYQAVKQVETATYHFVMGDPAPYKAIWSQADDVTIFGAWGAYEKGWEQVGPRLDWAAARFCEGHVTLEPLTMGMSGDLAYTVYIEKGQVRIAGRDGAELAERISNLRPMALRVTHIFRREEGAWKIIHRHADAIMEKIEAAAVLQR